MMRKGRLFWSQRKRQRSSDKEALGSPESRSESGGSSSDSELEWCCARLRPCDWEWEWLWELTLHFLDEAPPLDSPAPLVIGTLTSSFSGLAAAAPGTGLLVTNSGCRVRDKPFPSWAPCSLKLGCMDTPSISGHSLNFSALLESLLWHKKHTFVALYPIFESPAYLFLLYVVEGNSQLSDYLRYRNWWHDIKNGSQRARI